MVPLENGDQVPLIVYATQQGWHSVVTALAKMGADVNVMVSLGNDDQVPLFIYAAQNGFDITLSLLGVIGQA